MDDLKIVPTPIKLRKTRLHIVSDKGVSDIVSDIVPEITFRFLAQAYNDLTRDGRDDTHLLFRELVALVETTAKGKLTANSARAIVLLFMSTYEFSQLSKADRKIYRTDPIAKVTNEHIEVFVLDGELVTSRRFHDEMSRRNRKKLVADIITKHRGRAIPALLDGHSPSDFTSLAGMSRAFNISLTDVDEIINTLYVTETMSRAQVLQAIKREANQRMVENSRERSLAEQASEIDRQINGARALILSLEAKKAKLFE